MIPYGKQSISDEDIAEVVRVLRSDFITQGPEVKRFENTVAEYCGADFGVAVNSATSALHIACRALGVSEGDVVWTSPNTFVASANCALYCGAKVDFVDIDPSTGNLCVEALKQKLVEARRNNCLPKVIIPVHFAGQSCLMDEIGALVKPYGISIIEDASHAIGGSYLDSKIGACQFSDVTVFSFHPVKIVTTAEGGLVTTNSPEIAEKLELLRSHGVTRDPALMRVGDEGAWYYEQIDLGYNYRITELQAVLGVSQMGRLDKFVSTRNELANRYLTLLSDIEGITPLDVLPGCYSAYHLFVIKLSNSMSIGRRELFERLREDGIGVNVHYKPVHSQPYYMKLGFRSEEYPKAMDFYSRVISLPIYPELSCKNLTYINECLRKYIN